MVRLARRELAKRVAHGGQTTRYLAQNYKLLAQVARRHGYALAAHGSLLRDVDLIAVAWVPSAKGPRTLMKAMLGIVRATTGEREKLYVRMHTEPEVKPHGRLAWSLHFSRDAYLDVSVIGPKR